MLHATHAVHNGHKKILTSTIDTDIVVLACTQEEESKEWARFLGSWQSMKWALRQHRHYWCLMLWWIVTQSSASPDIAIRHHRQCGQLYFSWQSYSLTSPLHQIILMKMSYTPSSFMILLYDRTSTATNINKTQHKIFAKKNNVQLIPLTSAALK